MIPFNSKILFLLKAELLTFSTLTIKEKDKGT